MLIHQYKKHFKIKQSVLNNILIFQYLRIVIDSFDKWY